MTATDEINQVIAQHGGRVRDALDVTLARLRAAEVENEQLRAVYRRGAKNIALPHLRVEIAETRSERLQCELSALEKIEATHRRIEAWRSRKARVKNTLLLLALKEARAELGSVDADSDVLEVIDMILEGNDA